MRKIAGIAINTLGIYATGFVVWLALGAACVQHTPGQCGSDSMSNVARVVYAPIVALLPVER